MSTPPIRLLLVDDHPLVRDGLRARLNAEPDIQVAAEAECAQAALDAARTQAFDLVLMDVGMKGKSGIDATRALMAEHPALRILVLSMYDHAQYVEEALLAGARGYVVKDSPAEDIIHAIREVMAGRTWLSPGLAATPRQDAGHPLTPREREVLVLIAEGMSSRDIGERLSMGVRTVETHRLSLRRKLELSSHAALVRYAVEHRLRRQP